MTTDNASRSRPGPSAELLVASCLAHMGYGVAMPLMQNPRYDLILDVEDALYKVQVKWAQFIRARVRKHGKGDRAYYYVQLTTRHKRGNVTNARKYYTQTDFDILAVVCSFELIYYIPVSQLVQPDHSVCRQVRIKDHLYAGDRGDSLAAIERWEPYRNRLVLPAAVLPSPSCPNGVR